MVFIRNDRLGSLSHYESLQHKGTNQKQRVKAREVAQQDKGACHTIWVSAFSSQNPHKYGKKNQFTKFILWQPQTCHGSCAWTHRKILILIIFCFIFYFYLFFLIIYFDNIISIPSFPTSSYPPNFMIFLPPTGKKMRFRLAPVRMAKTNEIKIVDVGEGAGKEKQLLIAGGHMNWSSHCRDQCGDSSESQK